MKKLKKIWIAFLAAVLFVCSFSLVPTYAGSKIKPRKVKIAPSVKTVSLGSKFEVKAKITPSKAEDDYLQWSIVGKKGIVRFKGDRKGDDVDLVALKTGTTKLKCSIKGTSKKAYVTIKVKKPSYGMSMVGKKTRTVEAGDDFELKVKRTGGTKKKDLRWSIKNKSIAAFGDNNRKNDQVKFRALRPGTTTVTCTNVKSKKKVTFTVKVTAKETYREEAEDYDDEDYGDEDYDGEDYDDEDYDGEDYDDEDHDDEDYADEKDEPDDYDDED